MNSLTARLPSPLQPLESPLLDQAGVALFLKRDDLIHPLLSGNKWRKLQFNLEKARALDADTLLTFGGAYSNHLYAVAAAGILTGLNTVGLVRGHELRESSSPTLQFCHQAGMQLHFISREEYRQQENGAVFRHLTTRYPRHYWLPEGGSNFLALQGVGELVTETVTQLGYAPDAYCVPAGTGGTAAGILATGADAIVFPVLKGGDFLANDIRHLLNQLPGAGPPGAGLPGIGQPDLQTAYHFGGYGRYTAELLDFIRDFENRWDIRIEQVYSGKMLFGLFDLIKRGYFAKGTTLVAVHTGGLQGRITIKLDT